jgi:hypothetical protein
MMDLAQTTELERNNLEAHVDLCAMRYQQLDTRLTTIEKKVSDLTVIIEDSKNSMSKVIIASAATIVGSIISLVITILMKF